MVLHHIAQRARLFIITAALTHTEDFADRDLDVVNQIPIPKPFKYRIGEAEHQDVLHRLFAEVMVDAKNLFRMRVTRQLRIELAGRLQIVTKGLLDHNALPALFAIFVQQPRAVELLDGFAKLAWRSREIKEQVVPQRLAA